MSKKGSTIYEPYKSLIEEMALTKTPGTIGRELAVIMGRKKIGSSEITRICITLGIELPVTMSQMGRKRKVTHVIRRFPDEIKPTICGSWGVKLNDNRNAMRAYL